MADLASAPKHAPRWHARPAPREIRPPNCALQEEEALFSVDDDMGLDDRADVIVNWKEARRGVLVLGFEAFRMLMKVTRMPGRGRRARAQARAQSPDAEAEAEPGTVADVLSLTPDVVIVDEGHRIRDSKGLLRRVLDRVRTRRRVVLTGTPLQNHVMEYFAMVDWVRPGHWTEKEFRGRFADPIASGQSKDSTPEEISTMKKRSFILCEELQTFVHRRDYQTLARDLPPKHEFAAILPLSGFQLALYRGLLQHHPGLSPLAKHTLLLKICNHPQILKWFCDRQTHGGACAPPHTSSPGQSPGCPESSPTPPSTHPSTTSLQSSPSRSPIATQSTPEAIDEEDELELTAEKEIAEPGHSFGWVYEALSELRGTEVKPPHRPHQPSESSASAVDDTKGDSDAKEATGDRGKEAAGDKKERGPWWREMDEAALPAVPESGKLVALLTIIKHSIGLGDKIVVFSQFTETLDVIQSVLERSHKIPCYCIDGSQKQQERRDQLKAFARAGSRDVFLVSTRAGGTGVNLVAANRVVLYDVSWNPANDSQAIARCWRYGQTKPVYVYRSVSHVTSEETPVLKTTHKGRFFVGADPPPPLDPPTHTS